MCLPGVRSKNHLTQILLEKLQYRHFIDISQVVENFQMLRNLAINWVDTNNVSTESQIPVEVWFEENFDSFEVTPFECCIYDRQQVRIPLDIAFISLILWAFICSFISKPFISNEMKRRQHIIACGGTRSKADSGWNQPGSQPDSQPAS